MVCLINCGLSKVFIKNINDFFSLATECQMKTSDSKIHVRFL